MTFLDTISAATYAGLCSTPSCGTPFSSRTVSPPGQGSLARLLVYTFCFVSGRSLARRDHLQNRVPGKEACSRATLVVARPVQRGSAPPMDLTIRTLLLLLPLFRLAHNKAKVSRPLKVIPGPTSL